VEKSFAQEADALKALRAKWVPGALPKTFTGEFDPNSKTNPTASARAAQQASLFRQVEELQAERVRQAGKEPTHYRMDTELVDDVPEDAFRGLAAAATALGQLKARSALERLRPLADDPAPLLRGAAFAGLASLDEPGRALARQGLFDEDRDVQVAAARALSDQGPAGISVLVEALPKVSGERVRLVELLSGLPLPQSAVGAIEALVQEGGVEAALAADLLGVMKSKEAAPLLLKILDDPTSSARSATLRALGALGGPHVAETLAKDLCSDSPDVRAAAADALAQAGGRGQVEALTALRSDYYLQVRTSAERALVHAGTASAEGAK
jgi:HEAT repeat protein